MDIGYSINLSVGDNIDPAGVRDGAGNTFGLFGYIKDATIRNLVVTSSVQQDKNGVLITKTLEDNGYNGMIASVILGGDTVFDNVSVSGKIVLTNEAEADPNTFVGGCVGLIEAGTLNLINIPGKFCNRFSNY